MERISFPDRREAGRSRLRMPIGKYNAEHFEVSASEAVGIARAHEDPLGLEVVIPRSILASEVNSFYVPPKAVGWRYYPSAKVENRAVVRIASGENRTAKGFGGRTMRTTRNSQFVQSGEP